MNQLVLLRNQLVQTLHRFPATILSCILFCCLAIMRIHTPDTIGNEWLLASAFLASVWFTIGQLFSESAPRWPKYYSYTISSLIFAAMTAFLYVFPTQLIWNFLLLAIATLAIVPLAPFLMGNTSSDRVFTFSFVLVRQMIFALAVSIIILGGLFVIMLSISLLFDVKYPFIYADIVAVIASVLFSSLTLSCMPRDFERDELAFGVHFVNALIGYLVIPFLIFYGGILYWYFVVLCFTQSLPKGVIVYMSAGLGSLGVIVYLATDHTKCYKMATISLFQKYFFSFLLVPLFLMALAIGIRISEYGLSQARYIVVIVLLWLACIVTFAFTKQAKQMSRFVYLSATCFAVVAALTMGWLSV